MSHLTIRTLLLRDLRALRREVLAYPDDAAPWRAPEGIANPGGTLVLHLAGNLRHFVGAMLGGTGYVRDPKAEFALRDLPRARLVEEIEAAIAAVDAALAGLDPERMEEAFPVPLAGRTLPTRDVLMHLVAHLAYHLGQVDYHRRLTTRDGRTVGAMSVAELADEDA